MRTSGGSAQVKPSGRVGGQSLGLAGALVAVVVLALAFGQGGPAESPSGAPASESPTTASASASESLPTPSATAPGPTPITFGTVAERPGVPAELHDRFWLAEVGGTTYWGGSISWAAGQLGTTAAIVLPPDEIGLDADAGRVASALIDEAGSTILIRDIVSGALLATIDTKVFVRSGVLAGSRLFWSGFTWSGGAQWQGDPQDGGVWSTDLSSGLPEPKLVVPPLAEVSVANENGFDYEMRVSPSRDTVAADLAGWTSNAITYVIDTASLAVRATFEGGIPRAPSDAVVLTQTLDELVLMDIDSGAERWSVNSPAWAGGFVRDIFVREADLIIAFEPDPDTYVISRMDLADGSMKAILVQSRLAGVARQFSAPLSSASHLVLLTDSVLSRALTDGEASASLLDEGTGAITPDLFTLGLPR